MLDVARRETADRAAERGGGGWVALDAPATFWGVDVEPHEPEQMQGADGGEQLADLLRPARAGSHGRLREIDRLSGEAADIRQLLPEYLAQAVGRPKIAIDTDPLP